jgi:8-oxo-dGTP diphosphatase
MDSYKKRTLRVVTGILVNAQNQILVALRPNHVPQGGLWEFPGGKLEPDETSLQALQRELWEEIGVEVKSASIFSTVEHAYEDKHVILEAFRIHEFTGEPIGKEGQKIEWIFLSELKQRDFPKPNQAIINRLCAFL